MLIRAALPAVLVISLAACASGPAGSSGSNARAGDAKPQLSNALSARIQGSEQSQAALVKALTASYAAQLDALLDSQWTPAFTDSLMARPGVRKVLAQAKASSKRKGGKAQATAADLIPQANQQIAQRRAALHAPLQALEAALITRLGAHARAMDAMNSAIATGGSGALPTDISQSALPPSAQLTAALQQVESAITTLRQDASRQPKLLDAWPKLVANYTAQVEGITARLGG